MSRESFENEEFLPTEYAGKEPQYPPQTPLRTSGGKRVAVVGYGMALGMYIINEVDEPGKALLFCKIHPDWADSRS